MTIITVTGYKRCGKDTFCREFKYLAEGELKETVKIAFADKVKEYIEEVFNISPKELEEFKSNKKLINVGNNKFTARELLINVAENLKKISGNKLIWTQMTIDKIKRIIKNNFYDYILISDLRFNHELEELEKLCEENNIKLIIVRVHSDILPGCEENPNEQDIKNFNYDYLVLNNGPLTQLHETIQKILNEGD